jgi:hypothetical protein
MHLQINQEAHEEESTNECTTVPEVLGGSTAERRQGKQHDCTHIRQAHQQKTQQAVFSTVPSVRPDLGRGRDGETPSIPGQDGNGAVFLEQDGDGRLGRPITELSPSPAVNCRHPWMLISQCT